MSNGSLYSINKSKPIKGKGNSYQYSYKTIGSSDISVHMENLLFIFTLATNPGNDSDIW